MILTKNKLLNNNNQGVFLELLVTAKSAIIRSDTSMIYGRIPDNWVTNWIPDSEKWDG